MANLEPRPTIYNGIQMRSRLEAGFAMWLDAMKADWTYEPHALAHGDLGQYLPDFLLSELPCSWLPEPTNLYIEVKPRSFWPDDDDDMSNDEALAPYRELERMARIVEANYPRNMLAVAFPPDHGNVTPSVGIIEWQGYIGHNGRVSMDFYWPNVAYWATGPGSRLILVRTLPSPHGPWHGEWWKGKGN